MRGALTIGYALVWWASLIAAVVLVLTGNWGWAIGVFIVGNVTFGIGRLTRGAKVTGELRDAVEAIGYNDGTPAQVARTERCVRLMLRQSGVNPRFAMYPAELEQAVSTYIPVSRTLETPIVLLAAMYVAAEQLQASARIWGADALAVETDGVPLAKCEEELRKLFPDWYGRNDTVPGVLGQRLHAYIFTLVLFAATHRNEITHAG